MPAAPLPLNEQNRLEALHRYRILDTESEQSFDDFTKLAVEICQTPIALVSLVDGHRQWFKSKVGLEASRTNRDLAFCAHAILGTDVLVVPDARKDPRFSDNDLVLADPKIRFYAGAPIITEDGYHLGTLCVIDQVAREITDAKIRALAILARRVMGEIEIRSINDQLAAAKKRTAVLTEMQAICSHCRNFREEDQTWTRPADFLLDKLGLNCTHSICPECLKSHYGDLMEDESAN